MQISFFSGALAPLSGPFPGVPASSTKPHTNRTSKLNTSVRKSACVLGVSMLLAATAVQAQQFADVTVPGDSITTTGFSNPGEDVTKIIDNNAGTKFISVFGEGANFTVTPARGATTVTAMRFTTANDVPDRDPLTFTLRGSNDGGNTFTDITTNQSTGLTDVTARQTAGPFVTFANTTSYTTYQVVFSTFRGDNFNAFQLAEAELLVDVASPFVVTTGDDIVAADGFTSLREAINFANDDADTNAITFGADVTNITVSSSLPVITSSLSVTGSDAGVTIAKAEENSNNITIFEVTGAQTGATFDRLTISGADSALTNNGGTVNVLGSLFNGNFTGVQNNSGTATITNSTFVGNFGGIGNGSGATLNATNVTVTSGAFGIDNSGGGEGSPAGTLTLRNSLVVENAFISGESNLFGPLTAQSGNNITTGTAAAAGLDPDGLDSNGGPTQTIALTTRGTAVNAGNNAFIPTGITNDGRGAGFPRVLGRTVDIGAFEGRFDASGADSFIVTTTDDITSEDGFTSLREAIIRANEDDSPNTITFDATVFATRKTITLGLPQIVGRTSNRQLAAAAAPSSTTGRPLPTVIDELTIVGPTAGVEVAGRVGPNNAIFSTATSATANVSGLFFCGSRTGVRNAGTFNLTDGGLTSSTTNLLNTGAASLLRSSVAGATNGIQNSGTLTANLSTFTGNTNAIVNASGGMATVQRSTFSSNAVGAVNNATLNLSNSTLSGNGDGVRNQSGSATLLQSTFVGNTNAVLNSSGATLRLLRATVAGNGGGLSTGGGTVELRSTLLVGNGTNLTGTPSSGASNLTDVTAPVAGLEVDGNGFPLLKPNGGPTATVALLAGSRAIDRGEVGIKTGNDQRGEFPRVVNNRADIGAFEFQTPPTPQNLKDAAPSGGTS